jgi:enoyl-CoA hydratase/carnithine racemase
MEYILNNLDAGILKIELNRPQKRNALTQDELPVEFSERVRSADAREALTAFFEKRSPHFNAGETA